MNPIWEVGLADFLLVTVFLGGGAAFMTGRAAAADWRGPRELGLYVLLLGCAVRFLHFALFEGTLLQPYYYLIDVLVLAGFAWLGRQLTRAKQMSQQYSFTFEKSSPLTWKRKS
ncbi:hypothetical protein B7H23_06460 [Notoacmeibacter marinus]|uniref:DUF6867 domain-containing protein n=1 Tax=Notoacmeibacter marinus TaxID=1876515 RepID=A0A231V313_9HYPH|nr:hypothetical protein [Notoacmeibacter marinus]OXT02530.1 hypothetical protein B7H23_06460 [Notoacmeibacter marinus]